MVGLVSEPTSSEMIFASNRRKASMKKPEDPSAKPSASRRRQTRAESTKPEQTGPELKNTPSAASAEKSRLESGRDDSAFKSCSGHSPFRFETPSSLCLLGGGFIAAKIAS